MEPMYNWHYPVHQGFMNTKKPNFIEKLLGSSHGKHSVLMQNMPSQASLHETLYMIQKGLAIIQQLIPVWKQYGPLLKHAPFMVDMIKLMMEEESYGESEQKETHHDSLKNKPQQSKRSRDHRLPEPKLYI